MTEQCKPCWRMVEPVLRWAGSKAQHVKASCPDCGAYIAFVSQTPEVLALVGPKPRRVMDCLDLFQDVGGEGG